jgi:Secretion system C-terminal sorting domain
MNANLPYPRYVPLRKLANLKTLQFILMFGIILFQLPLHSQTPNNLWSKVVGGGSFGNENAGEVIVDAVGNYYITGSFSGSTDFGGQTLLTKGNTDAFVAKYTAGGSLLWLRQFGGPSDEMGIELSFSGTSIIVTGTFSQSIDFNVGGSPAIKVSQGGIDAFLAGIDANSGSLLWSRSFGGVNDDIIKDLASDNTDIFIAGSFTGTVNFNPDGTSMQFVSTGPDGFFARIAPSTGLTSWVSVGIGAGACDITGLALNPTNLYALSAFSGTTNFGSAILNSNSNSYDVAILAINKSTGVLTSNKIIGSAGTEFSRSIQVDNSSIYISGTFSNGAVDFNPGGTPFTINPNGNNQNFIARYDLATQNLIWAKNIGATFYAFGQAISVSNMKVSSSDVILSGSFSGTVDFNIQGPSLPKTAVGGLGTQDVFFARYNITSGVNTGVKTFGNGTTTSAKGLFITSTELFVSGQFRNTLNFNGSDSPPINKTSLGNNDAFISRYDINTFLGTQTATIGSPLNMSEDIGAKIISDGLGNIYQCGLYYSSPFQFGTSLLTNLGGSDIYISKLDASGSLIWIKQIGGSGNEIITDIYSDASGIYVTGSFEGIVDFNLGATSSTKTSLGGKDIFLAKYSTGNGSLLWVKRFGGSGDDQGESVIVDGSGIYLAGGFTSTSNFSDGGAPQNKTSAGLSDVFVAKYDLTGSLIWIKTSGNTNDDTAKSISIDGSGVYAAGNYSSTINFDGFSLPGNNSNSDIFITKLQASNGNAIWVNNAGSSGVDVASKIQAHTSGLYLTGSYSSPNTTIPLQLIFTPPPGGPPGSIFINYSGGNDILLAKFDLTTGNGISAKGIGGTNIDLASDLAVDDSGIYLTGSFTGTANLNGLGYTAKNFSSISNSKDGFIARYKLQDLELVWGVVLGGNSEDSGSGICVDNSSVYNTGWFTNYTYITPTTWINSISGKDALIAKYDKRLNQTVTLSWISEKWVGNAPFSINATSSSGLPVTFTSSNTAIVTVSGNTGTIISAGSTTITATQAGDIYYNPATAQQTLVVWKSTPAISITSPSTGIFGGTINLTTNTGGSTGAVSYAIAGGTFGVATLAGSILSLTGVGTITIQAVIAADANYNGNSATQDVTVYSANPALVITSPASGTYGTTLILTSTKGGSTGSVYYSVTNGTGRATISGSTLSLTGAGTVTIDAYIMSAPNYNPGSVSQTFTINKANPLLAITSFPSGALGSSINLTTNTGGSTGVITYSVTNGTGSATLSGSTLSLTSVGMVTVTASVSSDNNYNVGSVTQSITITLIKANQTIAFGALPSKLTTDLPFTLTASSNAAVATISGNILTIVGGGSATITASQPGNAAYNAATTVSQALTVNKVNQAITFNPISSACTGVSRSLSATSTSGLPITFTSSNTAIATISGSTLTSVSAGAVTITASQGGSQIYNPAPNVAQPFTVLSTPGFTTTIIGSRTFCQGSQTLLYADTQGSNCTFLWSNGVTTAYTGSITTPGIYSVTARNIFTGCTSTAQATVTEFISTGGSITSSVTCVNFGSVPSYTLTAQPQNVTYSYLWGNGATTSSLTMVPNNSNVSVNYTVTIKNSSNQVVATGCKDLFPCTYVRLRSEDKQPELPKKEDPLPILTSNLSFSYYPNPSDDELTIELFQAAFQKTSIQMIDQVGRLVNEHFINEGERSKTISTRDLAGGIYILQLGSSNMSIRKKIMVVHGK